jgi:hypothetical protein
MQMEDEIDLDLHYLFNTDFAEALVRRNANQMLDNVIKQTFPEAIKHGKQPIQTTISRRNFTS